MPQLVHAFEKSKPLIENSFKSVLGVLEQLAAEQCDMQVAADQTAISLERVRRSQARVEGELDKRLKKINKI